MIFRVHAIFEALHMGRNTLSMPEDQWECSETYFYYSVSKNCARPNWEIRVDFLLGISR